LPAEILLAYAGWEIGLTTPSLRFQPQPMSCQQLAEQVGQSLSPASYIIFRRVGVFLQGLFGVRRFFHGLSRFSGGRFSGSTVDAEFCFPER